jgi:hypothetical protein
MKQIELANNNLWSRGPIWFKLNTNRWPKAKLEVQARQVRMGKSELALIKRESLFTNSLRL